MIEQPTEKYTAFGSIVCERCHTYPQMTDSNWCAQCSGKHSAQLTIELQEQSLTLYGLQIGFEPKVGALVELAGDTTWLSWDETVELAAWLAARVAEANA